MAKNDDGPYHAVHDKALLYIKGVYSSSEYAQVFGRLHEDYRPVDHVFLSERDALVFMAKQNHLAREHYSEVSRKDVHVIEPVEKPTHWNDDSNQVPLCSDWKRGDYETDNWQFVDCSVCVAEFGESEGDTPCHIQNEKGGVDCHMYRDGDWRTDAWEMVDCQDCLEKKEKKL